MRRKMTVRIAGILALFLLAGSVLLAGPPPGPPPPPPPPEPEPEPEEYPCILPSVILPEELIRILLAHISDPLPEEILIKAGPLYESGPFKIFINREFQGLKALFKFGQLQKGAYIGLLQAAASFRFQYRDGKRCPAPPAGDAARSFAAGSYLIWMANARVLGIKPPPKIITMNWIVALISYEVEPDGKIDIKDIAAIIFYHDNRYRSPETMLKAARSLDDGGLLAPIAPEETL